MNRILAVCIRTAIDENKEGHKRLYVAKEFIDKFNELNISLIPIFTYDDLLRLKDLFDGLLLPGAYANVNPKYYDGQIFDDINYGEDEYQLDKRIIDYFVSNHKPIIGICAGIQELNVYFGGTLNQRIKNHCHDSLHNIKINKDSLLFDCFKEENIKVNTLHYQGIDKVAPGFKISAISEDNIIEGIEKDNIIAVQWHPELMEDNKLFSYFINKFILKEEKDEE